MRKFTICASTLAVLLGVCRPAFADVTAFIGSISAPEKRQVRGFAVGAGVLILGFEFEYAVTGGDLATGVPELKTWMGNGLLQSPFGAVQVYGTLGAGMYRETLDAQKTTGFGINTGGGVKIAVAGPLRVRVDYRVFTLRGTPFAANPQRVYVGANLTF